jgi:hypothetical protein
VLCKPSARDPFVTISALPRIALQLRRSVQALQTETTNRKKLHRRTVQTDPRVRVRLHGTIFIRMATAITCERGIALLKREISCAEDLTVSQKRIPINKIKFRSAEIGTLMGSAEYRAGNCSPRLMAQASGPRAFACARPGSRQFMRGASAED